MARLKAYHYGDVDKILESGFILPPTHVYSWKIFRDSCQESMDRWWANIPGYKNRKGLQAIQEVIEGLSEDIKAYQKDNRIVPVFKQSEHPLVNCEDMLSGEFDQVYFSPGWWALSGDLPDNGIVLDAERLIRSGAKVRFQDMNNAYVDEIFATIQNPDILDVDEARSRLILNLMDYAKEDLEGEEALEYLRNLPVDEQSSAEIIWTGPLDLANQTILEIWKDEKRLPRSKWPTER